MTKEKAAVIEPEKPVSAHDETIQPDDTEEGAAPAPRRGASSVIAWLALLSACGGIGAGYYLYQHQIKPLLTLPETLASYQQEASAQLDSRSSTLRKSVDALRQQQHLLEEASKLDQQRFHGLEENLAAVRGQAFWSTREWKLSEIKYLVQIASDRLQLMQDIDTAETALLAALGRLAELSDPSLEPLRQRLQHDVQRITTPADDDPLAMIATLETLAAQLKPYPREPAPALDPDQKIEIPEKPGGSNSPLAGLKSLLSGRIKIVHHDAPLNALQGSRIAMHQLELLKMRIEALRLALSQRNRRFYEHELNGIRLWLDANSLGEQGAALAQEVEKLATIDPFKPLPSLQPTLDLIGTLLSSRMPAAASQSGPDS